ncbi:MAG TPA: hypothetical protein VMH35_00710 [Streptosporangiaceae bacterium]|nr:hypothetical protein [Streptosporangiaceae bacterium]
MGFFDDVPAAEPEPRIHHPWDPPQTELPAIVQTSTVLLARTERAAVAVTGISAYSAGFEISLTARFRPERGEASGERRPGAATGRIEDPRALRRSARFGLQLADGRKVIGEHAPGPGPDIAPDGPILRQFMGGGTPRSHVSRWWCWPLPPAGPLEFVCEWSALGIPESRSAVDGQLILDAAARSIRLWSEDG